MAGSATTPSRAKTDRLSRSEAKAKFANLGLEVLDEGFAEWWQDVSDSTGKASFGTLDAKIKRLKAGEPLMREIARSVCHEAGLELEHSSFDEWWADATHGGLLNMLPRQRVEIRKKSLLDKNTRQKKTRVEASLRLYCLSAVADSLTPAKCLADPKRNFYTSNYKILVRVRVCGSRSLCVGLLACVSTSDRVEPDSQMNMCYAGSTIR